MGALLVLVGYDGMSRLRRRRLPEYFMPCDDDSSQEISVAISESDDALLLRVSLTSLQSLTKLFNVYVLTICIVSDKS